MQTFLPYSDFEASARVLDYRRLGKQRVEAWQILNIITGQKPNSRWRNHPAVKMWRGHHTALAQYGEAICKEWIRRGYKDTMLGRFQMLNRTEGPVIYPKWLGDRSFHLSHQSNLIRKSLVYKPIFPEVPDNLPYVWPEP